MILIHQHGAHAFAEIRMGIHDHARECQFHRKATGQIALRAAAQQFMRHT